MIWSEADANPLHRRIPGEVISRRRHVPKKEAPKEPEEVVVDLRAVMGLKPEARLKWLGRAVNMVTGSLASSNDLYDIVVNRKFVSAVPEKVVRKMNVIVQEALELFSEKQQRYLSSNECPIMARLALRDQAFVADDGPDEAPPLPPRAEVGTTEEPQLSGRQAPDAPGGASSTAGSERRSFRESGGSAEAPKPAAQAPRPPSGGLPAGASGSAAVADASLVPGAQWQSVKDEWAVRRAHAESKEQSKRDAVKRAEREKEDRAEEEAASRKVAQAEAEMRRKLEAEADALFDFGLQAPAAPLAFAVGAGGSRDDRHGGRGSGGRRRKEHSRSRSISSRTARRMERQSRAEKADGRGGWRKEAASPGAVSGSRAIFMNRNFVEDLPHMPRPNMPGAQGTGGMSGAGRSRSRSREQRERRRRG